MADIDLKNLTDRYVAVWASPDRERRHAAVRELWAADTVHVLRRRWDSTGSSWRRAGTTRWRCG